MSAQPITGRKLIKQILDAVHDIDAPVYLQASKGGPLKAVWFVGHQKKLGEGTVLVIRQVEP